MDGKHGRATGDEHASEPPAKKIVKRNSMHFPGTLIEIHVSPEMLNSPSTAPLLEKIFSDILQQHGTHITQMQTINTDDQQGHGLLRNVWTGISEAMKTIETPGAAEPATLLESDHVDIAVEHFSEAPWITTHVPFDEKYSRKGPNTSAGQYPNGENARRKVLSSGSWKVQLFYSELVQNHAPCCKKISEAHGLLYNTVLEQHAADWEAQIKKIKTQLMDVFSKLDFQDPDISRNINKHVLITRKWDKGGINQHYPYERTEMLRNVD